MANKSRSDIEAAVGQLLDLANNDPNNVPVLMALAHGFLLLKQTAKARNQLKVSIPDILSQNALSSTCWLLCDTRQRLLHKVGRRGHWQPPTLHVLFLLRGSAACVQAAVRA